MAVWPCTIEDTLDYDCNSKGGHLLKKNQKFEPTIEIIRGNGLYERYGHWQN